MEKEINKVIRPSINKNICYARIPIVRKIIGTGSNDTDILLNCGIPILLADLSYNLETGIYSCDTTLSQKEGYCASFSTTRLLQLLPCSFLCKGKNTGIMLFPETTQWYGHNNLVGIAVNTDNGEPIREFHGHPITVLVQLLEFIHKSAY